MVPAATADAAGLMHFDLRPDNSLIMNDGGGAVVLDWNWVRRGPG
jgi:aminoglycoside phosphotransferase (APT) family kinase protein